MIRWTDPDPRPDPARTALGLADADWDRPHLLAWGQHSFASRMPTAVIDPPGLALPLPQGAPLDTAALRFDDPLLERPIDWDTFVDRRLFSDGLLVMHRGRICLETYRNGYRADDLHVVHSCSKTLTTMMVGIAVAEGRLDPAAPITRYVPALSDRPAWAEVTLQHVLDMAAGIDCDEDYDRPDSMYWRYARAVGYAGGGQQAEGAFAFLYQNLVNRADPPGSRFLYASYLTNLLPIALEHAYGVPAIELYATRLYARIGAEHPCEINVDSRRLPIVEGQVNLTLRDFARWAALFALGGRNLAGEQVLPASWIAATIAPDPARRAAFLRGDMAGVFPDAHYANQCWVLDPARQQFAMLGIHGQFAWFDVTAQLMIVGMGSYPVQVAPTLVDAMRQLWAAVGRALAGR